MPWISQAKGSYEDPDIWWNNQTKQYAGGQYGAAPSAVDQFAGKFATNAPAGYYDSTNIDKYINSLAGKGIGIEDMNSALSAGIKRSGWDTLDDYGNSRGENYALGNLSGIADLERVKWLGQSFDGMGKDTGWNNFYNADAAAKQQAAVAAKNDQLHSEYDKSSAFSNDIPMILGGMGAVLGGGALAGAFGGAAGASLPSALSTGATFEGGLGATLGGNAGLGISGSLGTSAGGVLGGAGSFADIAAGGLAGGIGGAAGVGALPSIGAGSAGGVGSTAAGDAIASGTGGGGKMDYLDLLSEGTNGVDGMSAADAIAQAAANGGSEFGVTSAGGPLANGWQGALANALPNMPPGLSSAIKALMGGGAAGGNSLMSLLGKGAGGVLDYMSTSKAADNAKAIADRTWGAGQQYRDNASRAMTPGFDLNSIPGYSGALSTGMDAFNRSLSAKNGNPWGQGGAAGEATAWAGKNLALPAWQNYFNSNSNAGGLSNLATQSTAAGLNYGQADAAGYGSLARTVQGITNPKEEDPYQALYKAFSKQYGILP